MQILLKIINFCVIKFRSYIKFYINKHAVNIFTTRNIFK